MGTYAHSETSLADLTQMIASGEELERLSKEFEGMATEPELNQVALDLAEEVNRPGTRKVASRR